MLINLSADPEVLEDLVKDDKFVRVMLDHIVVCTFPKVRAKFSADFLVRANKNQTQTCWPCCWQTSPRRIV
jgi:hypothetical protein